MKGLCCGVNDYQDWQNVIWNDLPIESPINVGGRFIVPLSCCKKEHLTLSSGAFFDITNANISSINQGGCLEGYFRNTKIGFDVLTAFNISITFLQIVLVLGVRLLFLQNRDYRRA